MLRVLYADFDFEPITILDIQPWAEAMLADGCRVRFSPPMPVESRLIERNAVPEMGTFKFVEVWGEPVWRNEIRTMLLFTNDDELALTLRSEFLPGQQRRIQDERRDAFVNGFLTALGAMR